LRELFGKIIKSKPKLVGNDILNNNSSFLKTVSIDSISSNGINVMDMTDEQC